MSYERLRPAFTFDAERLEQLKAIVPEAFADGAINWDALRAALDEHIEEEGADTEHFGLFWPGKRAARRRASEPSQGTLIPVSGEGMNEDTTRNIFIEADNLDALKLLQKAYAGRVKMIYIDPPYNTGKDFVYDDDFRETTHEYLQRTGQISEQGQFLTTNAKANGRFHSNWLNMMYPRLQVARSLLTDDGIIFVSIDDNELHNLVQIMNEIFGDENSVGIIAVQLNPRGRHLDSFLAKTHEYVVVYARDIMQQPMGQLEKDERMLDEYNQEDKLGRYRELGLRNRNPAFNRITRPNLFYPIYANPSNGEVALQQDATFTIEIFPVDSRGVESCWTWGQRKFVTHNNLLTARQIGNGEWRVFRKDYLLTADGGTATTLPKSLWLDKDIANDHGKKAVKDLFGDNVFDFPKSPELMKRLIKLGSGDGDIVLDFFAGSGSSAQAVIELNQEDEPQRSYIMVQLRERTPEGSVARKMGFQFIPEVTKERIRRVLSKTVALAQQQLPLDNGINIDLGFKVYQYALSSFREWQDYDGEDTVQVQTLFDQFETPLIDGWQPAHLLTEVMLLQGFPLDGHIEALPTFTTNTMQRVTSDFHAHSLFVCFDTTIADETINALALGSEDIFVCLDSALTDESKARLSDVCNLRTI